MRRLILVRHAKTEREAASGRDFDRALTDQGRRAAEAVGHALAAAGLIPSVVLSSDAVRTRESFAAMSPSLPDARLALRHDLYNASADTLMAAAQGEEAECIMVLAHNPGVGALAQSLAERCTVIGVEDRSALQAGFPTAVAAAFEFDGERTACLGVFAPAGEG